MVGACGSPLCRPPLAVESYEGSDRLLGITPDDMEPQRNESQKEVPLNMRLDTGSVLNCRGGAIFLFCKAVSRKPLRRSIAKEPKEPKEWNAGR